MNTPQRRRKSEKGRLDFNEDFTMLALILPKSKNNKATLILAILIKKPECI